MSPRKSSAEKSVSRPEPWQPRTKTNVRLQARRLLFPDSHVARIERVCDEQEAHCGVLWLYSDLPLKDQVLETLKPGECREIAWITAEGIVWADDPEIVVENATAADQQADSPQTKTP